MSRRRIKENKLRRQEERGLFSSPSKPTRFDNSHTPRTDYLDDEDDYREPLWEGAHMKRSKGKSISDSLYMHDIISMVLHVLMVISLVVVGIVKLSIFPVVVLAVLVIMMLIGYLLRTAPFYVPFGIAFVAIIIGALTNNTNSVLIGLPAMYGIIILTRDL